MRICDIIQSMWKLSENLAKVARWLLGLAMLWPIVGCRKDSSKDVLAAMERSGGASAFVSNCTQVVARGKQEETENLRAFLIDADDAPVAVLLRGNYALIEEDLQIRFLRHELRRRVRLQLKGGFCHKGLVVSVSGEKLSEDRAKQSSQASERWRWKRLDDFIYWYEE